MRVCFPAAEILRALFGLLIPSVGLVLFATGAVQAGIKYASFGPFDVTFYGNADGVNYGQGWDFTGAGAQDWSTQQIADVGAAIAAWDGGIGNVAGRQINLHAYWYDFGGGGILGGSYSPSNGDGTAGWNYGEHVWRDRVNYDAPFKGFDTIILLSSDAAGLGWNFGTGPPSGWEIDFRSVMTHELGHSLGFDPTYDSAWDDWGNARGSIESPGDWAGYQGLSMWDKNLLDGNGNRPISGWPPADFDETGPVFWDGVNAMTYYGGPVPIYAPDPFEPGSSLSHLDWNAFPQALMSPFYDWESYPRAPGQLEWAMMQDMGWSIVPEPSTLVIFAGLSGVFALWQRRRPKPL